MNPIIRNILAVIAGWFCGSIINMGLIQLGHVLFPIEGLDPENMESLAEIMPGLDFQYFIFPFLAHALGTLIGAFIAGIIAANHKMKFALAIGVLFLIGGIYMSYLISGPIWFSILDIALAYIPMAWLGGKIALGFSKK